MTIFDEYAKLALQQGLVSTAEEETNKRYDTQDLDTIEMLYHVKPNGEQKHIMEQAHPETIVISPAHDRMDGIMENEIERQNISLNVATKPTTGNNLGQRYVQAKEDLFRSLMKTSWWLDRENEHEMMSLSDSCMAALNKEAALPLLPILGIVALVGALGAGAYKMNHPSSHGFPMDLALAQKEISEAIEDYPQLAKTLQPLLSNLRALQEAYSSSEIDRSEGKSALMQLAGAKSNEEKRKLLQANSLKLLTGSKYEKIVKSLADLRAIGEATLRLIPGAIDELSQAENKYETPGPIPAISDLIQSTKKYLHYIVQSDTEDAVEALQILASSLNDVFAGINEQLTQLNSIKSQVEHVNETDQLKDLAQPDKTPENKTRQDSISQDWA